MLNLKRDDLLVCSSAFTSATAMFFLAALMLVPITGAVVPALGAPGFITVTLIFIELFGLPIIAAFIGLNIGMKLTTRSA